MPCNKVTYETKEQATKDARLIEIDKRRFKEKTAKTGRKLKPYLCDLCDQWHLTTQPKLKFWNNKRKPL